MNVVENNNSFTQYLQVWPDFIFTDKIPGKAPLLATANKTEQFENIDKSIYTLYTFKVDSAQDASSYDLLLFVANFQLKKEFRQGQSWIFDLLKNGEESIRSAILPGTTVDRSYTPSFSNGSYEIPYTSIDPIFDFENCRIVVGLDFGKLYFNGWVYVGNNLAKMLWSGGALPPFSDTIWLLKDFKTNKKARFDVTEQKAYILPGNHYDDEEDSDTLLTTTIMNEALNKHAVIDQGVFW